MTVIFRCKNEKLRNRVTRRLAALTGRAFRIDGDRVIPLAQDAPAAEVRAVKAIARGLLDLVRARRKARLKLNSR